MKELVKNVGERGQDNLIAGLFPRALIVPVSIVAGAGELARGTVLSCKEDGTCEVMAAGGLCPGGPRGRLRHGGGGGCRIPQRELQS